MVLLVDFYPFVAIYDQKENGMPSNSTFWPAFYVGLTAPVALFCPMPGYSGFTSPVTTAQSFAAVGALMTAAAKKVEDEQLGKSERAA